MADESRKRARLSLEQKLWIIHHKTENQRITNAKVALDFSVKFNRPTSRQAICYVLKYKDEILRDVNVDPEKNIKKAKYVKKDTMAKFEADLLRMLEEKDKIVNLTYAIVKLCGQEIQKRPEYADCVEIQNLKFSNTMISTFAKSHGIRKIYLKNNARTVKDPFLHFKIFKNRDSRWPILNQWRGS